MILAILQARMSSSRLPGKVMKLINNEPILKYEIDRIKQSKNIDKIVLATSVNKEDDVLEELAYSCGIECFRGDLNNVLDRFYQCATLYKADTIVRLTGDCPIIDAEVIDDIVEYFIARKLDYVSNSLDRTFPDGLDVEVFTYETLSLVKQKAKKEQELEHVTTYISSHLNEFKISQFKNDIDYSYIRWTLDTIEDFYFFKNFIESTNDNTFSWKELLNLADNDKYLIESNQTIRYAMKKLEEIIDEKRDTLYVIDSNKIIGTVASGDIRRSLIYGNITNNDQIIKIANKVFHYIEDKKVYSEKELKSLERFSFLPVLKKDMEFIEFKNVKTLLNKSNYVVLMAGGLGSRLKGITSDTPKPMLKIGGKPILETILDQFSEQNFFNFIISVNYFADNIKDYFMDGLKKSINIKYLEEKKRLGTAGCLSLIDDMPNDPFFVMNGDILTDVDFNKMLEFHTKNNFEITVATVKYNYVIPYGVIEAGKSNQINKIIEKPTNTSSISAGIYILNPSILLEIPKNEYYDITTLFNKLLQEERKIGAYNIDGYWLDIGHPEDFYKAHSDYHNVFKDKK